MATRKNRPILYEAVQRDRRSREPSWRRRVPPPSAPPTLEPAGAAPDSSAGNPPRSVRVVKGKLRMKLGWPGLTVLVIGAAFVLYVAFQAGTRLQRSQQAEGTPATEAGGGVAEPTESETTGVSVLPDARPDEERPAAGPKPSTPPAKPRPSASAQKPPPEPAFEFKKGYHYVVAQHFYSKHYETAVAARDFLRAADIECVVVRRKADVELVVTRPFLLRQDDAQARASERRSCDALKARIRQLGKEFAKRQADAQKPQYPLDQPYERLHIK